MIVVGQGLAGTLVALEAERRGRDVVVVDEGSGATASRAAAGLFNPLTGPRFTADDEGWDRIIPFYREWEQRLGLALVHPIRLFRPWAGTKVGPEGFPRWAPGWKAEAGADGVWIEGGGWVDIGALLDAARSRWLQQGRLEVRRFEPQEGRGQEVVWCGGPEGFGSEPWKGYPGVAQTWQAVRGDVLTVRISPWSQDWAEVGSRFLLPIGSDLYRWGATHESDIADQDFRAQALEQLLRELATRLGGTSFEVTHHAWGVRPASRTGRPLVIRHQDEPGWTLFNGFGGRGVSWMPRWLQHLDL